MFSLFYKYLKMGKAKDNHNDSQPIFDLIAFGKMPANARDVN